MSDKIKTKNNLKYLPWSVAWAEVKKVDPDATFRIIPQVMDDGGNTRFWHDDGKSGWVEVGVTVNGLETIEVLAIMDMRNKAIQADAITAVEANKSLKRCLTKACALHGLGIYIYSGEEIPEEIAKVSELQNDVMALVQKKCSQSDNARKKVAELCKEAEKKDNPQLDDDLITGDPRNIGSVEILEDLKRRIMAVRK